MKKNTITTLLVAVSLAVTLFTVILVGGQSVEYDPWIDVNDDGKIDMKDIGQVARAFGATGTAINKTALLLELQDGLEELNATVDSLSQRVTALEGQGAMVICAETTHYTTQSWTQPPATLNPNQIKIDFPVTFTNPSNVELSVSGTVTTGTCAGYPFRVTGQQIETTYAVLSLQGWNGASWVNLNAGDEVDISYVAIEK